jgi:predicted porin
MKKSLFAMAAVGAFAGAAQAQSSVTVYGLLDYGYGYSQQRNATGTAGTTITNQNTSGFQGNGESTSRIGFRGTEDLGGGTRAFFTVEAALNTDQGGILNSGATGNRQTFLGLAQKGIGQASIGIQYTPIHEAAAVTDAGGLNNQNGNVIYDRTGGFGAASGQVVAGTGTGLNSVSGMSTNTSYTIRSTNMLMLKSERFSGLQAKAMIVQGGKDSNTTTQTISNDGFGGSLDYQWNKLFVTANYQTFKNTTLAGGVFAPGYNGAGITPGVNTNDTQQYYAATYDFGILKAYAQFLYRKATNSMNNNNYVERKAQQIGVRAPVAKNVDVWASGGIGNINAGGNTVTPSKFNGWQIGSDYSLSKRTNLYAIYGQTNTSGNIMATAYGTNTATTAPNSFNAVSYAVGVRHTF